MYHNRYSIVVDPKGIEPSTLRMRTVRSPKLSYEPVSSLSDFLLGCVLWGCATVPVRLPDELRPRNNTQHYISKNSFCQEENRNYYGNCQKYFCSETPHRKNSISAASGYAYAAAVIVYYPEQSVRYIYLQDNLLYFLRPRP